MCDNGGIHSDTPPAPYVAHVGRLNAVIQGGPRPADLRPIQEGHFQAYNEVTHHLRGSRHIMETQEGLTTAFVIGHSLGENCLGHRRARFLTIWDKLLASLPHATIARKLDDVGDALGLRCEPTITIHINRLKPHQRSGS